MNAASLIRLALGLLTPAGDRGRIVGKLVRAEIVALLLALAGLAGMAAIGMAGAALWTCVARQLGSAGASLVLAGAFLVVALALLATAWLMLRDRPARIIAGAPPVAGGTSASSADAETANELVSAAITLFKTNKAPTLLAAVIAGVITEQTRRRK